MNYTYKQIWLINLPVMMSVLMEQLINITDAVFLGHVGEVELGASALAGIYYLATYMLGFGFSIGLQVMIARRNGEQNYAETGRTFFQGLFFLSGLALSLCLLIQGLSPFLLKQSITSPENLSGCNGLSGLAQFRTFIFISLSGTPGFLCGNNKDQVLILGRNSSRTYQHPFQLPVNIYLKIWDSRIGNSLNASRNGIVNHSPYPYVEKD